MALNEAMAEQGLELGTIITRNEEEGIDVENGTIDVIPAWRFLLNLSDFVSP